MNYRGYQQYKQQSINTMTQAEMLILLYDEIVKRLTVAEYALDKQDYVNFDAAILRTQEIIKYLTSILDRSYTISSDIYKLYDYFMYLSGRIKAGRKKEPLLELKQNIIELRETFKEADKISSNNKVNKI